MNADAANWALVAVGILSLLGGAGISLISVGKHGQRVSDLEKAREEDVRNAAREMEELKRRIAGAENAASAVKGLAVAIENMGDKFTTEVSHMVEKFGMETGFIREQLSDLKGEMRGRARATANANAKRNSAQR